MQLEWEEFLDPYIQAVGELKIKLRGIRKQYRKQKKHSPIEFVTGRVKPIESIKEKMALRGIREENLAQDMQDIAGLRVMVQFVDDVEEVLDVLRNVMICGLSKRETILKIVKLVVIAVTMLLLNTPLIPLRGAKRF